MILLLTIVKNVHKIMHVYILMPHLYANSFAGHALLLLQLCFFSTLLCVYTKPYHAKIHHFNLAQTGIC
jgi:hypothetical protein